MTDDTTNLQPNKLFQEIESIFKNIGFTKQQIIIMDITAGSYLVTNPTEDLPRVICSLNEQDQLKVEYSEFSTNNLPKFTSFLSGLRTNSLLLVEGELIDTSSGLNLEEFEIDDGADFDYASELTNIVLEYAETLTSLKFYLTLNATKALKKVSQEVQPHSKEAQAKKLQFEDEIALIINFISKRTTKSIQSKHLLELYPGLSKKECLQKLKIISERGYLKQSGPWFLLNQ